MLSTAAVLAGCGGSSTAPKLPGPDPEPTPAVITDANVRIVAADVAIQGKNRDLTIKWGFSVPRVSWFDTGTVCLEPDIPWGWLPEGFGKCSAGSGILVPNTGTVTLSVPTTERLGRTIIGRRITIEIFPSDEGASRIPNGTPVQEGINKATRLVDFPDPPTG